MKKFSALVATLMMVLAISVVNLSAAKGTSFDTIPFGPGMWRGASYAWAYSEINPTVAYATAGWWNLNRTVFTLEDWDYQSSAFPYVSVNAFADCTVGDLYQDHLDNVGTYAQD